jgi:hypothetical protein
MGNSQGFHRLEVCVQVGASHRCEWLFGKRYALFAVEDPPSAAVQERCFASKFLNLDEFQAFSETIVVPACPLLAKGARSFEVPPLDDGHPGECFVMERVPMKLRESHNEAVFAQSGVPVLNDSPRFVVTERSPWARSAWRTAPTPVVEGGWGVNNKKSS